MSTSTNAMLVYGYHLGGEDELPDLDWYNPDEDDDFQEAAERKLLADLAGFTETWDQVGEGHYARRSTAMKQVGVEFETHCSGNSPMFLLATKTITVYRGSVEEIDPADLLAAPPEWDTRLRAALDTLGLNPTQETARWLLCSYWG
ncbi:hypothetical protein ACFV1C_00315 [Streptomyces sp. NPDC059605]|uniref:hypothetical protein n=1 Tax=Streptomyces sp. NPDC059605 TaxID=3346882 RepID=UPI003688D1F3